MLHSSRVVYLRDHLQHQYDRSLWYTADTGRGASGSPVFNRHWEVVALHRATVAARLNDLYVGLDGAPMKPETYNADPSAALHTANVGTRTSRIVSAFEHKSFDTAAHGIVRDAALASWESIDGQDAVREQMRRLIARQWNEMNASGEDDPISFVESVERAESTEAAGRFDLIRSLLDTLREGETARIEVSKSR